MASFFVSCALGLERSLLRELTEKSFLFLGSDGRPNTKPLQLITEEPGGVLLEGELLVGLQIPLFSKLANRVLIRIAQGKTVEFFQLENLIKKTDLKIKEAHFHISCSQSKIGNEKRVLEIFERKIKQNKESEVSIFVRIHKDVCEISLDISGHHLHKRGYKKFNAKASLRETLASLLFFEAFSDLSRFEMSEAILIDPFCGSGTLLFEAAAFYTLNKIDFTLLSQFIPVPKLILSESFLLQYSDLIHKSVFSEFYGFDIDPKEIQTSMANKSAFLEFFPKLEVAPFHFSQGDLFTAEAAFNSDKKTYLICNSPYGDRLKLQFSYQEMVEAQIAKFKPQRIAFIIPKYQFGEIQGYELTKHFGFQNGGIAVEFYLFQIKK